MCPIAQKIFPSRLNILPNTKYSFLNCQRFIKFRKSGHTASRHPSKGNITYIALIGIFWLKMSVKNKIRLEECH